MTTSHEHRPDADDIDMQMLGRAVWRAKGWIVGLAIGAGVVTFIVLSMMRPLYTSEVRILIQNDESAFTRPTSELGRDLQARALDEQAVQSQVQVLTSRDLTIAVIQALDLINNPAFEKDAGTGIVSRLLKRIGISAGSEEERAANAFAEHLSVYQLSKSSVIAVEYTSGDPGLAAAVANKLADIYIDWQREAKLEQTKDATAWLSTQIEMLRPRVAEAEAAAEQFRASEGLFAGTNNVTLNAQQLSELNSQLILAKAQRSEAEARARLIKKMLADRSDIDVTSEVLSSELIARLVDQRVQVQRQLAELSATLLPSHPRIKQLTSELADVRAQVRAEAAKIAKSLENEAEVAAARETSLRDSLNEVKTQASGASEAEIKLRALEREAKAQRDLLESYLARFRDASARHDMGAVPAQATIVGRAHASIKPSFPKRGPMSLLAAAATALLALAYVLARELIGTPAGPRVTRGAGGSGRRRHRIHRVSREQASETRTTTSGARALQIEAEPKSSAPAGHVKAPASDDKAAASSWQPKRPILPASRRPAEATATVTGVETSSVPHTAETATPGGIQELRSAAGFLERLHWGAAPDASNSPPLATEPAPEGLLTRIRRSRSELAAPALPQESVQEPKNGTMPMRSNDLRHYLNQRLAASAAEAASQSDHKEKTVPKRDSEKVGPVLKSLDAVVNHVLAAGRGGAPRALLIAGASDKVDATREAIAVARALVDRGEQIALVDLARGPAAISGPLELPRSPGLADVTAGRASFEDVVKIDSTTPLQVIPAGNPKLAAAGDENERFAPVFEALVQAYDCVVLHADLEAMRKLTPALKFELPLAVVVLPAGVSASNRKTDLADFSSLGCPVVVYEQSGKQPRSGLFRRVAAG